MSMQISVRTVSYGHGPILQDIELTFPDTGIVLIAGRNGMGKTTLLRTIMGMMPEFDGAISVNGLDPYSVELETLARSGVAMMPQEGGVFDELSVEQNLQLTQSRESAEDVLSILHGWSRRMRQPAGTLSGGERKILGLARAVGQAPSVLLADEPTEGVWHERLNDISEKLSNLSQKALVLVVEQNLANFLSVADTVCVLERGMVALNGPPRDVAMDPELEKLLTF